MYQKSKKVLKKRDTKVPRSTKIVKKYKIIKSFKNGKKYRKCTKNHIKYKMYQISNPRTKCRFGF